jgi:hypothetical protein
VKSLGVWIGNDKKEEEDMVTRMLNEKIDDAILRWKPKAAPLSLRGRVIAANKFIAPRLWHILQCHSPSKVVVQRLQSKLVQFVWGEERHWVKGNIIIAPVHEGGLGLVAIHEKILAFRMSFIQRLLQDPFTLPWKVVAAERLRTYKGLDVSFSLFLQKVSYRKCPHTDEFYNSIMCSWALFSPEIDQLARQRNKRPFPTGWPPPSPLPQCSYKSVKRTSVVSLPICKKDIYSEAIYLRHGKNWRLKGAYCGENIEWASFREKPNMGAEADIAWRLAHGRLADMIFLHKAGLRQDTVSLVPRRHRRCMAHDFSRF